MSANETVATIAARIRELRGVLGLSQTAFGALAGVTKSAVCHWERGGTEPTLEALTVLHEGCGVSLNWLRHGADGMFDPPQHGGAQEVSLAGLSPRSSHLLAQLIRRVRAGQIDEADLEILHRLVQHLISKGVVHS